MRKEKDSLGELELPSDVYYGIQSYRASKNFQISGTQIHPELIKAYIFLKRSAANANCKAGVLDSEICDAIVSACNELLRIDFRKQIYHDKYFIIDAYQAGAGTSQNMNANEVIANKANELLGHPLGSYQRVHPNDHVNMSQSTNDSYPTVMRLATLNLSKKLAGELTLLSVEFDNKAQEFDNIIKAGRTHLQDAVPIRLGQEFSAYKSICDHLLGLVLHAQTFLRVLGIGGSAVGSGINVPKGYRQYILEELKESFEDDCLELSPNMFEAMQSQMPLMVYSNALRTAALEFTRICNDLRLMSSGPSTGLAEIFLPSTQPGSSIMPGKVNPSILEMANQVFFKILGNDTAMSFSMQAGQLELNVMMPVMAQLALESTMLLTNTLHTLRELCIKGIRANAEQCERYVGMTSQIATALNPIIGYARAGELAKEAVRDHKSMFQIIREKGILTEEQIEEHLNLRDMTEPK